MEVDIWKYRGETLMRIDDGWSAEMEQVVRDTAFDGLEVGGGMGSFEGLDAVADKIRWLHGPAVESWAGLERLSKVERITFLNEIAQPQFDFRKLPCLRLLESSSAASLHPPFLNHPALEVLDLQGLAVKDMGFLSEARRLRALQLKGSSLKSLAGLERCSELSELHVAGSRALTDITALTQLPELEIVELVGTRNLPDITAMYGLAKLRCLFVESNMAKPRDLEWLRGMARLECAGIWVESAEIDWKVFAEHPRLYDVSFFTAKDFEPGPDEEILAVLESAGRSVKTLTRYPKGKFPGFHIEFAAPSDLRNPMPFYSYQNTVNYSPEF